MLQHKTLALKGNEAGKPQIRKTLFFAEMPRNAALQCPKGKQENGC